MCKDLQGYEPLLAGGVPDLSLDEFGIDGDCSCLKLDADGGLGVQAELVLGEPRQKLGFPDGGVADHHHFKDVGDPLRLRLAAAAAAHFLVHLGGK